MKVLITGAGGQLGYELARSAPREVEIISRGRPALDITDPVAIEREMCRARPDVLINAAAYTAVDRAESEPGRAFAVNAEGARSLAASAARHGARLIHLSTDFVFDGAKGRPYLPDDAARPESVYGASKLEGERFVEAETNGEAVIVRTAWVYSAYGHNFVKTMLRLMRERESVGVVADQVGTPTWAKGLAMAVWGIMARPGLRGVYHWTDAGVASWYDFAVAVQEEALALGLLGRRIPVRPIRTRDYPTPAKRPAYSVLDKTASWEALSCEVLHWRAALRSMLCELKGTP
jgi:dTDP-4-dehydrorhamnose reductase